MSENTPEFYIEQSKDPFSVNQENYLAGEYIFHGADEAQLSSILKQGINRDFFIRGKSGKAFYTTTDMKMALNHAVTSESSKAVIMLFKVNKDAKISEGLIGN